MLEQVLHKKTLTPQTWPTATRRKRQGRLQQELRGLLQYSTRERDDAEGQRGAETMRRAGGVLKEMHILIDLTGDEEAHARQGSDRPGQPSRVHSDTRAGDEGKIRKLPSQRRLTSEVTPRTYSLHNGVFG